MDRNLVGELILKINGLVGRGVAEESVGRRSGERALEYGIDLPLFDYYCIACSFDGRLSFCQPAFFAIKRLSLSGSFEDYFDRTFLYLLDL